MIGESNLKISDARLIKVRDQNLSMTENAETKLKNSSFYEPKGFENHNEVTQSIR